MIFVEIFREEKDLPVRYDGAFGVRTPDFIERHEDILSALNAARDLAGSLQLKITICPGSKGIHRIITPTGEPIIISSWQIETSGDKPCIAFLQSQICP